MNGRMREPIVKAFNQETNTETEAIEVPAWARNMYVFVPQLDSCSLSVLANDGTVWGKRGSDLDGNPNPRVGYTGGSATVHDILWFDVTPFTAVKLASTVAQANKSVRVFFVGEH